MKSFFLLIAMMLAALPSGVTAGDLILDQLNLGSTTPKDLERSFPGTRTEIPQGDGQTIVHFKDANGNSGVCRFVRGRLYKYTVALVETAPGVSAAGNWDEMVESGLKTLGTPKLKSDDYVAWDLQDIQFILSRRIPKCITVTLGNKQLEQLARKDATALPAVPRVTGEKIHGGPYFFKGFRPDNTRKVKLTRGIYSISSMHKGRGNFIVWMYSAYDEDLVANEIGYSVAHSVIRVDERVREVFFAIEDAGGPWEIDVKKMQVNP